MHFYSYSIKHYCLQKALDREPFAGYSRLIQRFHLALCGGGKEGDFLSEGMMGLQADVTETSQNPMQARTLYYSLLISVVFHESERL